MFWKRKNDLVFLKTIRFRLIVGYASVLFIAIILVSLYFSFQMKARLLEVTRQYLNSELKGTIELLRNETDRGVSISGLLSRHTPGITGSHRIGYALFDEKGFIIARSQGFLEDKRFLEKANSKALTGDGMVESTLRDADNNIVYLATQPFLDRRGNTFYLQFEATPFAHQEAVMVFLKTGLLMIPFILLIAFISGAVLTNRFLSPISRLIKASNEIMTSDPNQKLPVRGTGDELDRLACAFNNVLSKLRDSYEKVIIFTANASHEIRLPITAIKGEAEVVLERGATAEEYQAILEGIVGEMDRLTIIINRLLYLSRGDIGLERLDIQKVELRGLLSKMSEFYRLLAEKKNISLSFLSEKGDFYIRADPSKIKELFSNLIENAIRYTPENGSVTLRITRMQAEYKIAVSDTGIGIPEKEHEKIFERFYRVDKARSREDGGAGLGLSIARMIVNAHKGRIEVESYPRKGSTFSVILPL